MISSHDDGNIVDDAIACSRRNIIQDSGHVSFNNKNISKKHRKNEKKIICHILKQTLQIPQNN